jgi:hypothetical protein
MEKWEQKWTELCLRIDERGNLVKSYFLTIPQTTWTKRDLRYLEAFDSVKVSLNLDSVDPAGFRVNWYIESLKTMRYSIKKLSEYNQVTDSQEIKSQLRIPNRKTYVQYCEELLQSYESIFELYFTNESKIKLWASSRAVF